MSGRRVSLEEKLEELKMRRENYLKTEIWMLSPDGIQSYGMGSRNVNRYNLALKDIQDMLKKLEDQIDQLEDDIDGQKPRKAVGVIIRDW